MDCHIPDSITMDIKHYTYRVSWSPEDHEHVGLCTEFPSLSWLAAEPAQALAGIMQLVDEMVQNMQRHGEAIPPPLADKET